MLTDKDREKFSWLPSSNIDYSSKNQSSEVFWIVNLQELFNIDLSYPGIKTALNTAMKYCKQYVPKDTGLTMRSLAMIELDKSRVKLFFDPKKIVGQKRKGEIVRDYYVAYIADSAKNFNWLSITIYQFYTKLFSLTKELFKKQEKIIKEKPDKADKLTLDLTYASLFVGKVKTEYKEMKDEKKKLIDIKKAKDRLKKIQIEQKKEELLEKKKLRAQRRI